VIVQLCSTWTGIDWDRPTFRAFLARPGETRVAPVPVVVERSTTTLDGQQVVVERGCLTRRLEP
jgi:hypothetical protein